MDRYDIKTNRGRKDRQADRQTKGGREERHADRQREEWDRDSMENTSR